MGATLDELKLRVLDIADHTGSSRVVAARLTEYINAMCRELNNMVLDASEHQSYNEQSISVVSGTEAYNLDSDFKHLYAVWYTSGTDRYKLERADIQDFDYYHHGFPQGVYHWSTIRYILIGAKIYFVPLPSSSATIKIWYQGGFTALSAGSDEVPDYWPDGSEDFVTYGAAAMVLARDKAEHKFWTGEKERMRLMIERQLIQRDRHEPYKIKDVMYEGGKYYDTY